MTDTADTGAERATHFLTQSDEMSLADERAAQTPASQPDTLEVRDDSLAILQGTMGGVRRPVVIAVAVVGAAALVAAAIGILLRGAGSSQRADG
jgi:hypothetical protein